MANDLKCTMFFTMGKYGWSESFYKTGQPDLDAALKALAKLAKLRAKMCGGGVRIEYLRVSDVLVKRDSLVDVINIFVAGGIFANAAASPGPRDPLVIEAAVDDTTDQPYSAILLRQENGPLYRRMMYLRGNPDSIIVAPPGPVRPNKWDAAFRAWSAECTNWFFPVIQKTDLNFKVIKDWSIIGGLPRIAVLAHGWSTGNRITTRGGRIVAGDMSLNHSWSIKVIDADLIELYSISGKPYPGTFTAAFGGEAALQPTTYVPIVNTQIRGETHRDTGRPFDAPRGRRPAAP